jgi:hypothetical protein
VTAEDKSGAPPPQPELAPEREEENLDNAAVDAQDNSGPGSGDSVDTGGDESDGSSDHGGHG